MKTKILFGALMGTFALAACNSEEEFTTPAQKTSPITFEVTLDGADAATKAEFASGKINFELGDLLSLYHGIGDASADFIDYSNAVYEAKACGDGEVLKFVSAAMVNEGEAVMVWPADTMFTNDGSAAPVITIPAVQDAKTKLLMPYVSEVLTIDAYDDEEMKNVAGYNKTYPVVLKQFGSTLTLNTKAINDDVISNLDVADLKVTDVELTAKSATANLFNTSVALKALGIAPTTHTGDFDHWADVTEADFTAVTTSATLKTTDATNTSAIFTLLPVDATTADVDDHANNAKVVINTNYGTVTVAYASGKTPWAKTEDKLGTAEAKTVSDGLEDVLKNVYIANTTTSSKFRNEKTGGKMTRWIEADISKLDMNNLHIKDAEQLIDVLKVLDAMKEVAGSTVAGAATINFYLDGDAEGVFTMTPAAAAAYTAHLTATAPAITFTPCAVAGEACTAVKFVAESETEVPTTLAFETNPVDAQLAGTWKWSADDKDYTNVNDIVVLEDATLNLSNTVKDATGKRILNYGSVNVSGITYLENTILRNLGTITIPANAEFRVKSALANRAETLADYGKIYNSGVLATVGTGSIYNHGGYIKQMVDGAKTYITSNETGTGFAAAFNSGATPNLIGTIELFDKDDDNYSVSNTANQGFIMITTTAAAVAAADLGVEANYVKLAGDCTSFTYSQTSATARLQYVEIASSKEVVWTSASTQSMKGVIVPAGKKLNIKKDNTVISAATFVKGTIYQGGAYTPGAFVTYLGGVATDAANIITY